MEQHNKSAINNAGFDIIGDNSLMPYYKNIGLQVIIMILFLIGGIGYPVIHDVVN
ncbi:potassium transporter TrkG [Mycoplasmopsis bovis]|uniref:potassium transporter TrkG n=1 Tax=Mycoplasmopsis bovis TaxID=28903 RepID=UPI003D2D67E5